MLLRAVGGGSRRAARRDERGRGTGEVSPAVSDSQKGSSIAAAARRESEGK